LPNGGQAFFRILRANGNGSFSPGADYFADTVPYYAVLADFGGDGKLDLAATGGYAAKVSLFQGNGDGSFQASRFTDIPDFISGATAGDFDEDGLPDIAASVGYEIQTYISSGGGGFIPGPESPGGQISSSAV